MDRRQLMLDEARIYYRPAAEFIRRGEWEKACSALLDGLKTADMALQSLTPGGSEYVGDPARCVAFAKRAIDNYRMLWREAVEGKKIAEQGNGN